MPCVLAAQATRCITADIASEGETDLLYNLCPIPIWPRTFVMREPCEYGNPLRPINLITLCLFGGTLY